MEQMPGDLAPVLDLDPFRATETLDLSLSRGQDLTKPPQKLPVLSGLGAFPPLRTRTSNLGKFRFPLLRNSATPRRGEDFPFVIASLSLLELGSWNSARKNHTCGSPPTQIASPDTRGSESALPVFWLVWNPSERT